MKTRAACVGAGLTLSLTHDHTFRTSDQDRSQPEKHEGNMLKEVGHWAGVS